MLLAEDNKINQQFAIALLGKAGHKIDIAENGLQAVDAVRHARYDAVLMDVQMPELDGVEATKQIRALAPPACSVHIIAMTANAMTGAEAEYLAAGMDDYISKPVDGKLLLSKLAALSAKKKRAASRPGGVTPTSDTKPRAVGKAGSTAVQLVLDAAKLAELADVTPAQPIAKTITLFLAEAAGHLAQIEQHRVKGDLAMTASVAQSLAGISDHIGAMELSALAREVEIACKQGKRDPADRLSRELVVAGARATAALTAWLEHKAAPGQSPLVTTIQAH